jgi:NAD(P)-dependent dehydrogenase (short-subunit alcohol dehydrogenase family)
MATGAGRVALGTGANRSLGLETARQLLDRGLRGVMTGRDEGAVRRALASLAADEGAVLTLRLDVTDPATIAAAGSDR